MLAMLMGITAITALTSPDVVRPLTRMTLECREVPALHETARMTSRCRRIAAGGVWRPVGD